MEVRYSAGVKCSVLQVIQKYSVLSSSRLVIACVIRNFMKKLIPAFYRQKCTITCTRKIKTIDAVPS